MFDFEKLNVYKKALQLNKELFEFLKKSPRIDYYLQDQLKRASTSIILNIAEGTGRLSKADKGRFYTISRGSTSEVVAVLEIIDYQYSVPQTLKDHFKSELDDISRMLLGLIQNTTSKDRNSTRTRNTNSNLRINSFQ